MAGFLPLILTGVSMLASDNAQKKDAEAARAKQNYDAATMQRMAIQEQAQSQVMAGEERSKARQLESRAMALAAASGAGASDPQVAGMVSGIAEQGNLNARARLYEGDTAAAGRNEQAGLLQWEGDQIMASSKRKRTATLINGASQMASYYKPSATKTTSTTTQGYS